MGPRWRRGVGASPWMIAAVLVWGSASAHAQTVGAMGDSLSDEYAEGSYSYAMNWVQQLAQFRGVDFGPTAAQAGAPGGTWGEPRRTQYAQNWARSGADSSSLLADGQHTGLASQIVPMEVEYVLLAIGANDFAPIPFISPYQFIYSGIWSEAQIQNHINNIAARIQTAMDTVLAAGDARFIVANVPDYGVTPIAMSFFPNATNREKVTAVISQLNDMIEAMAEEREIVLLDIEALATAIFGTNHNRNTTLAIGNVSIFLQQSDTSSNTNPQAGFVHDNIHPHTTLQGLFANAIMTAMNTGSEGADLTLFSEAEILAHAGLAYGGADTLGPTIGEWSEYVIDFSPPDKPEPTADLDGSGSVDVFDLLMLLGAWGGCEECTVASCPADLDGSCAVDVFDLLILLGSWG